MINLFYTISLLLQTSIYSISVNAIDGGQIDFNAFNGKKILVVNIATGSSYASQLADLQQLQDDYADSLVVIGFPSNSFGNESRDSSSIKEYCHSTYGVNFRLAVLGNVKGDNIQPIYYWLTHTEENGAFNSSIQDDFQKYLFDSNGEPLGVFAASVPPLSDAITSLIHPTNP